MARRDAPRLGGGEQGLERCAGIDEHGHPRFPVGDEVRVREPVPVHASFDEQAGIGYFRQSQGGSMGLLERIINVIQAKLSKLVGRAEDPRETLDYSYEKQL